MVADQTQDIPKQVADATTPPAKGKHPGGRPPMYTVQHKQAILAMLAAGLSIEEIGRTKGLPSKQSCYNLIATDDKFLDDSLRAMGRGCHAMAHDCLAIADDPDLEPHDKRVRIDTRMRLMGKWLPKVYGDRITHEHEVGDRLSSLISEAQARLRELPRAKHAKAASEAVIDVPASDAD